MDSAAALFIFNRELSIASDHPGTVMKLTKAFVEDVRELTDEFGSGFTTRNLELMRQFFLVYHDRQEIAQPLIAQFDTRQKVQSTIGIILCKQKNKALVEITLPENANIHAREYQLYLPSKDELQRKLVEWLCEEEADE